MLKTSVPVPDAETVPVPVAVDAAGMADAVDEGAEGEVGAPLPVELVTVEGKKLAEELGAEEDGFGALAAGAALTTTTRHSRSRTRGRIGAAECARTRSGAQVEDRRASERRAKLQAADL